jgi:hypothetical protein
MPKGQPPRRSSAYGSGSGDMRPRSPQEAESRKVLKETINKSGGGAEYQASEAKKRKGSLGSEKPDLGAARHRPAVEKGGLRRYKKII